MIELFVFYITVPYISDLCGVQYIVARLLYLFVILMRIKMNNIVPFFAVILFLASLGLVLAANEVNVDTIYFPDDGTVNSISKRQVNNILNLVYQAQDRIADNRYSIVNNQRQQQAQQLQAPQRNPTQTSPSQLILPTIPPSYLSAQSQLVNYNYDPVTDFAWNIFKVSWS